MTWADDYMDNLFDDADWEAFEDSNFEEDDFDDDPYWDRYGNENLDDMDYDHYG